MLVTGSTFIDLKQGVETCPSAAGRFGERSALVFNVARDALTILDAEGGAARRDRWGSNPLAPPTPTSW